MSQEERDISGVSCVPALKDSEREHSVASAWRPALRAIVAAFVRGDFRLREAILGVEAVDEATAKQIEGYLASYGETLDELSDETWKSSVAQWMGGSWDVLVDLWTVESGRSDLVLSARVFEQGDGHRIAIHIVYVP